MRSFEFVQGGSAKFWEIQRAGCDVSVRFGRVGAQGQTSVKTLPDAAAATAHETKLITEKLRKGYVETTAPTAPAPASPTPDLSSPDLSPAGPADVSVVPGPLDEDTFVLPASWHRCRAARRGSAGVSRFVPGAKARATLDQEITRGEARIQRILTARTTQESTRLVTRAWLDGAPDAPPLGAAVVALILKDHWWRTTNWANPYADVWIAERGLTFAAEAAVTLMALILEDDDAPPYPRSTANDKPGVRHRRPDEFKTAWAPDTAVQILLRVRQALAAASGKDYAEVVTALEPYRAAHPYARAAASALVPDQRAWFEEDVRYATGSSHDDYLASLLLTAASTPEDMRVLTPVASSYTMSASLPMLITMIDGVGADAAPALFEWFDRSGNADTRKRLLSALEPLPGDEITQGLIDRIDTKHVTATLLEHSKRYPARVLRLLAEAAGQKSAHDLLRSHLLKHRDLADAVVPRSSPEAAKRIERILADSATVAHAPLSAVPPVLADPPWRRVTARGKPVVISGLTCDDPATLTWLPDEREQWEKTETDAYGAGDKSDPKARLARIFSHQLSPREAAWFFCSASEDLIRPALPEWKPSDAWMAGTYLRPIIARFGLDALPSVLVLARRSAPETAEVLLPFSAPEIAVLMADWLSRLKSVRETALTWLRRHPADAARALIPPALGKTGKTRQQAETALLALHTNGQSDQVRAAARGYGAEAAAAIEALLALDPFALDPAKIPPIPAWVSPGLFPPVPLRDGSGALPDEAVNNLITMLALSRPGEPHPGVAEVREACEPAGLSAFGWSVFELWQANGANSKESWALDALALFGDDETVRRLSPLILVWPGENGHNKAVTGLWILSEIGTDVALMHLHGIAQRSKFTGLKDAARQKMAEVAATLGLTAEQLADRLVPDFGLEPNGSLRLDYGPRQFVVGFDEQLRPFVADTTGKRIKALPKPGVRDDATLAPDAYKRFAALKKDIRTIAADQVRRLEQAMVTNRRWSGADFRQLYVDHPLLWHIVRRLVWARFDNPPPGTAIGSGAAPTGTFRVAEDRTFSTVDDEETTLPDDAVVGVAHPLHLGETLGAWAEVLADYEILQPFPQLGRPTFVLTEEETKASRLTRFEGVEVPTTRLLSMERKGWEREAPQDAGVQSRIEFTIDSGREMVIEIEPGIAIGYIDMNPDQRLTDVFLHDGTGSRWRNHDDRGHVTLGSLDPVTASEILRDLTELTNP